MTRFRGIDLKQLGSLYGGCNCNVCVHAELAYANERGVNPRKTGAPWPPTVSRGRQRLVALGLVPSGCVGSNNAQNGRVLVLDYGIATVQQFDVPIATHNARIRAGRQAEVTIGYGPLHGTRWDSAPTFSGRHAVRELDQRTTSAGLLEHLIDDPMADGRWLYSLGRRALKGPQWWSDYRWRKAVAAAHGGAGGYVDAAAYTIDIEPGVAIVGAGINVRTAPTLTAPIYASTTTAGLKRRNDGLLLAGLRASFVLQGWVDGDAVGGSRRWAKVRMLRASRFVHSSLVRYV